MTRDELLDFMAERTLDQIDPVRKDERAEKRAEKKSEKGSGGAASKSDDKASNNQRPAPAVKSDLKLREEIISDAGEIQLAVEFESGESDELNSLSEQNNSQQLTNVTDFKQRARYISA